MRRGFGLVIGMLLLLGGCVAAGPEARPGAASQARATLPAGGEARLTPPVANPGQPVTITYRIDYPGSWSDVTGVSLVGLPDGNGRPSSLALPLPPAPGKMASSDLSLPVPARAGTYPLQLIVTSARGQAAPLPVGTLTVNQMPATLSDAEITPALHSVGACSGASLTAELSYTIESANGAAAVSELRLIGPELARLPVLPRTPLDLKNPTVLAPPPTNVAVQSFPVRVLTQIPPAQQQVASAGPAPIGGGTLLLPSSHWDRARDRITTPIEIPCSLPAPTSWRLAITGVVGGAVTTNTVATQYRVTP